MSTGPAQNPTAELADPGDPDARMDAYYYGFDRTGIGIVDDILSAVASAGKHGHHTETWTDRDDGHPDSGEHWYGLGHGGACPQDWIQNAANHAAAVIRAAADGAR